MKQLLYVTFAALILCVAPSRAQTSPNKPLTNADIIEMSRAGVPAGTIATLIQNSQLKFDVSAEGVIALHAGGVTESVINQMIRSANSRPRVGPVFGVATATFPLKDAAGKKAHFSAWIKTENVMNGYAGLWWRVDGPEEGKNLAFDNSQARFIEGKPAVDNGTVRGATGTSGWAKYEFELPVAAAVRNINFGAILTGTGTAWFDALSIELDGAQYSNPQLFDLDFESTLAKGFYTGGDGYKVGVDNTAAYQGKQSLRMQYIGDGTQTK